MMPLMTWESLCPLKQRGMVWGIGILLPNSNNELALRYGQIIPSTGDTSLNEKSELGIGFNYYVGEHAYKIQSDIFQFWSDDGFMDGDTQARIQIQMAY